MNRVLILALLAILLVGTSACKTERGDREFIPGKGWVPVSLNHTPTEQL